MENLNKCYCGGTPMYLNDGLVKFGFEPSVMCTKCGIKTINLNKWQEFTNKFSYIKENLKEDLKGIVNYE